MKKQYELINLELIQAELSDILTASGLEVEDELGGGLSVGWKEA